MSDLLKLLKEGNKPSLIAAIVNTIIAGLKAIAFFFTGNVAMFAEMLHSLGDAANQFFVFIGSALSKKAPTPKFPNGFGRVVNLVCLGAVIIVAIMSYEALKEGWHHVMNPVESGGFLINLSVLGIAIILEFTVLYKAGKEILHEAGVEQKTMLDPVTKSFHIPKEQSPLQNSFSWKISWQQRAESWHSLPSCLHISSVGLEAEGIASIVIGLMMFYVVGKVFLENARGVIGETDEEMLNHISHIIAADPDVKDIQKVEVIKEGEFLHVEVVAEIDPSLTVAYVDDIRDRLMLTYLTTKKCTGSCQFRLMKMTGSYLERFE